jgi:hypothetical protein
MNWLSQRPPSSSAKVGVIVGTMTVGAALAGTGVAWPEALVGAARSDGTVWHRPDSGLELIAQAAIARASTVQAAIAKVSIVRGVAIVRQVVARGTADDRSPLVPPSCFLIHCIFCSSDTGGFLPAGLVLCDAVC